MSSKCILAILALSLCFSAFSQGKGKKGSSPLSFPLTEKHWSPLTDNVSFTTHRGAQVVKSSNDEGFEVELKDVDFSVGTIAFDVALKGRGFPGIKFRLDGETENAEIFYLRHFGKPDPKSRTTLQYAAVMDGVNLWDVTDDYQAAATLSEEDWNHIKMVVSENQMKVYVNDMDRAAMYVPILEGLTTTGKIRLTGNVLYANMEITPGAVEDLPPTTGYDPTYNDPNYLRNWEVQNPIDFPMGRDVMRMVNGSARTVIDEAYFDVSKPWKTLEAGPRAIVNLTEEFGGTKEGTKRLTWLRATITSKAEQEKWIKMGFSDEIWVFINGQPLHEDKNYYGSPGMKAPRGRCTLENTKFRVPLQEGKNELLIGVSNYFFGWGLLARLEDTAGLEF